MSLVVAFTITPVARLPRARGGAQRPEARRRRPPRAGVATVSRLRPAPRPLPRRAGALPGRSFGADGAALRGRSAAGRCCGRCRSRCCPSTTRTSCRSWSMLPRAPRLERTDAIARRLAEVLRRAPEVRDFEIYTGLASPMDFNGMVRHYYLRRGPHVADIRVNLLPKRRPRDAVARDRAAPAARARGGSREAAVRASRSWRSLRDRRCSRRSPPRSRREPGVPYERLRDGARALAARLAREPGVGDVDSTVKTTRPASSS